MKLKPAHWLEFCLLFLFFCFFLFSPKIIRAEENLSFIHQDHLGSTGIVTDGEGNSISQKTYYPYGSTRSLERDLPSEKQYTGQVSDVSQTGLYYYNARYYSPQVALFTQADVKEGAHRYSYVGGNPVIRTDPTGNISYPPVSWPRNGNRANQRRDYQKWKNFTFQGMERNKYREGLSTASGVDEIKEQAPSLSRGVESLDPGFANSLSLTVQGYYKESLDEMGSSQVANRAQGRSCVACISPFSNDILLVEEEKFIETRADHKFKERFDYSTAFVHEARHVWQVNNDSEGTFVGLISSMAFEAGLTKGVAMGNDMPYYYSDWSESEEGSDPYGKTSFPIRAHHVYTNDDGSASGITWTFPGEIDAIIAETIHDDPGFKYSYPEIYNQMLGTNFFNKDKFKPYKKSRAR